MGDIIDSNYLQSAFDSRRVAELANDGAGAKLTIINDAISAAESEVHNLLSRQYSLVELQNDASIKRCVAISAMFILEIRRSDVSKGITFLYNQSLSYLQRIVSGEAKLNAVAQVLPRITHTNENDVFEASEYFSGMPSLDSSD